MEPHATPAPGPRRADLVAGATTAVLLVPQALAYSQLAGLPPAMGLYAATVPLLAYAAIGRSPQLAIGPVALDSLLLAAALAPLAASHTPQAAQLALLLTFLVGVLQLLLAALRMGFIANFLSRPVLSGFTSAAAALIAASHLGPLLGVAAQPGSLTETLRGLWERRGEVHGLTLLVGALSGLALVFLNRRWPRFPAGLALVAAGSAAAAVLGLGEHGVAQVGSLPDALPRLSSPLALVSQWRELLPAALSIALVSFTESLSVARRFSGAVELDANRELCAVGSANLVSSCFGGFVVAGGLSRSAVQAASGAATRWAGVVTALLVLLAVTFAGFFQHLPRAVLAALVLNAVAGLLDVQHARRLWRVKRSDFWLLLLTLLATLTAGPTRGLALGAGGSLLLFLIQTTQPHVAILGRVPGSESYRNMLRFPDARPIAGQLIVRVDAQFYFGNVSFLKRTLAQLVAERPGLRGIILDASGMNQLDSSALDALLEIERWLAEQGIALRFAELKGPVRDVLARSGWLARLQAERRTFLRVHEAVLAAGHGLAQPVLSERHG